MFVGRRRRWRLFIECVRCALQPVRDQQRIESSPFQSAARRILHGYDVNDTAPKVRVVLRS
ncbi:hypothetical protein XM57_12235 [Burkholderia cepacia]|nr:hypothetical protein XM57_12235 [Burkholderia cepacia]AYZ98412.1 hypothetical protein EGY28_26340 [Burkholderia dolosa]ETP66837.1 hypothetical protein BDSB_08960 [Burkholderia dolosa PC543]